MEPIESLAEQRVELKSRIEQLTEEIRQLEPVALAGEEAQRQIDSIQASIEDLSSELNRLHDVESSQRPYVEEPGLRYGKAPEIRPKRR